VKTIVTLPAAALALVVGASGFFTAITDAQSRVRVTVKRNTPAFYAARLKLCDDQLADSTSYGVKGAYYRNGTNDLYIHARGFCLSDVNPASWDKDYWRHYGYSYGYYNHWD
jgi:hypothetical protein